MTTTNADGLLTQAEVDLAARYEEQLGLSHEDAVRKVKAERVGPARLIGREDEVPARNVPGGEIANPSPNAPPTPTARKEQLLAERARIDRELEAVEDEILATTFEPAESPAEDTFDTNDLDTNRDNEISDDELRKANVDDLVELAEEYPELRVRIIALEREKGDAARVTLLRALGEPDTGEGSPS